MLRLLHEFCIELRRSRTTVYFSHVLRIELARGMRRMATITSLLPQQIRSSYDLDLWGINPLIRQRWLTNGVRRFNTLLSQFAADIEIPTNVDRWIESIDLMASEGLEPTDALHLACARFAGVADFYTADADFRRIAWPQIHLIRDPVP